MCIISRKVFNGMLTADGYSEELMEEGEDNE